MTGGALPNGCSSQTHDIMSGVHQKAVWAKLEAIS